AGGDAVAFKADVSKLEEVEAMFDHAEKQFGKIDILVNTAGVMHKNIPLADMDDDIFDKTISINVKGPFNTMRLAAKRLEAGGKIINFSTSVTKLLMPTYTVYAASKSAIETMTNIFAKELRGRNITVNAVAPGPTATDLFLKGKSDELIEELTKKPPLERLGQPADIADIVEFLVSDKAGWINGQTIFVNGGII
ncbi:MAG: SDR family oxidoreductase, partial [Desulforhopalus sp.]